MRYTEFKRAVAENETVSPGNLLGIKQDVLDKIEQLPQDKNTRRTLERIKELLNSTGAVDKLETFISRINHIGTTDTDVAKAVDQLAKLIGAVVQITTPKDREFFFKLWESDRIVKVDDLMKGDKVYSINELFSYYGKSKAVTYVVNSLARDAGYGLGKGELLLAVLSKKITQPIGKGDLIINDSKIEVKTTDGGSPRFADQEVRVGAGYEQVRDTIYKKYENQIAQIGGLGKTGYNLENYIKIGQLPDTDKNEFKNDTKLLLSKIFPDQDSRDVVNAIMAGDFNTAKVLFANHSFERYMNVKDDDAVLYIDLSKEVPTYVMFSSVEDLQKLGLTFKPKTIYILGSSGNRDVYPQMAVVNSK